MRQCLHLDTFSMLPCYPVEYSERGTYYDCAYGGVLESKGGWLGDPVLEIRLCCALGAYETS